MIETGFYNTTDYDGNVNGNHTPVTGLLQLQRHHNTKKVDYSNRGKTYQVHELQVGTVLTHNAGGWGDCSLKPYVVTEIFTKKTNPNKGAIYKADICPIVRFDDTNVIYDSNKVSTIQLIFSTFSSQHRIEGWNYDNKSLGSFIIDELRLADHGIVK